jgi:hypothetical protein
MLLTLWLGQNRDVTEKLCSLNKIRDVTDTLTARTGPLTLVNMLA